MSDSQLEALRRKKLRELERVLMTETKKRKEKPEVDLKKTLNQILDSRAWKVLCAARTQYPRAAISIENTLIRLHKEGKITNQITGEELYALLRRLGLRVRLPTRIKILEHGKAKSLEEKIKEETNCE